MSLSYRTDPVWADVIPVPQDDGPHPVVCIAYSEPCQAYTQIPALAPRSAAASVLGSAHSLWLLRSALRLSVAAVVETMDYFRGVLKRGELSERALALTGDVIEQNSANYTAWAYRRSCLYALGRPLEDELRFAEDIARATPKNYQLWHHRRALRDRQGQPGNELAFTEEILQLDAKNYHVWSHRQWLVERFGLWSGEVSFVDRLLDADVRNNSAWNYRFFLLSARGVTREASGVRSEAAAVFARIGLAPNNESPWNFLVGLSAEPGSGPGELELMEQSALKVAHAHPDCAFALSALIDLWETPALHSERRIAQAREACDRLADTLDVVRRSYWRMRKDQLSAADTLTAPASNGASGQPPQHHDQA